MSKKFLFRSDEKEILDFPGMPVAMLDQNFKEMDFINQYSAGFLSILTELKRILTDKNKEYSIIDIGCGSGEMLIRIEQWAARSSLKLKLYGLDNNPDAISIAQKKSSRIQFINDSFESISQAQHFDIILSSLFCHHLSDNELVKYLKLCKEKACIGFIINDLLRHPIPYYTISVLSRFVRSTKAFRNDAPLSVLRGFTKEEFATALNLAGIDNYKMKTNWAFRFLVSSYK